jgi:hypothetical protein
MSQLKLWVHKIVFWVHHKNPEVINLGVCLIMKFGCVCVCVCVGQVGFVENNIHLGILKFVCVDSFSLSTALNPSVLQYCYVVQMSMLLSFQ